MEQEVLEEHDEEVVTKVFEYRKNIENRIDKLALSTIVYSYDIIPNRHRK